MILFHLDGKDFSAFGAFAGVLTADPSKADLHLAGGAFAIDMRFAVFPFVFDEKDIFTDRFCNLQKFLIFRHPFRNISGKHPIKNEDEKEPRKDLKDDNGDRIFYKEEHDGKKHVDCEHTFAERIGAVTAVKK